MHRQNTGLTLPIPSLQSSLSCLNSTTTPASDTVGTEPEPQSTFVCYIFALLYLLFASCQWLWCGLTDITNKLPIFDDTKTDRCVEKTHTPSHTMAVMKCPYCAALHTRKRTICYTANSWESKQHQFSTPLKDCRFSTPPPADSIYY